ncbi:hypothetical protein [Cupriavidus basilensis]
MVKLNTSAPLAEITICNKWQSRQFVAVMKAKRRVVALLPELPQ